MDITKRKSIKIGMLVDISCKNGEIKRGYITKVLSQAGNKKGIRVEIETGDVGHVVHVVTKNELRLENFKFYNRFFFEKQLYTVWCKITKSFLVFDHYNSRKQTVEKTALLFDSEQKATAFIKGSSYDSPDYFIRPIHRRKPIVELFAKTNVDYFRINGTRKISKQKLGEWEYYFKQMR